MKKMITMWAVTLACSFVSIAQTTAVQFGPTAQAEATVEKVAPLLNSPNLSDVDALCTQVAADGLNDAGVRTKLFTLGQAVSVKGPSSKHQSALEALFAKYAKESASPVQQLFFVEQLRWIGTKRSLPIIKELCGSKDVNVAASANMTRQAIEGISDPATVVYPKTKIRLLGEDLAKASESERFKLLAEAVQTKGDIAYQAFAINKIKSPLSSDHLKKWCDVTRKSDEPLVIALLLRSLGANQDTLITELLLDMCGNVNETVSSAALTGLAQRDAKTLQQALPSRLANVNTDNYKTLAAFLSTLPATVTVPALTTAYPKQNALGKRLIFETLAAHPGSDVMVKAALVSAIAPDSDVKLATAAFRYLRQNAGPKECEPLLASISTMKGALQSEAVQAYALAARRPGNEGYGDRLLQALTAAGATPSETLLDAAGRIGSPALLTFVGALATTNKDAQRTLSTWRDGLAAPALMQALAQKPEDAFLLRSVRQQLQSTMANTSDLMKGWKALEASGKVSQEDLRDFATIINKSSNIALNRPVSATLKQEADRAPKFLTDGAVGNDSGFWVGGSPVEMTVDLESVRSVAAAHVYFYTDGGRYYQYRIDTSVDNKTWKLAVDKTKDTTVSKPEGFLSAFEARDARYVKLTVTKNSSNPSVHVNELMVFSSADAAVVDLDKIQRPQPKPDAEGFLTLFDGMNLDAWKGNKTAYTITENKEIFVDPSKGGSGDLFTVEEYGDFVLRFEFKLTPGANNGIGVRTPGGNAAYEGFEIQVLEDTAPKYATLQPYQFHGSVYGIIPAKRGAQKPVGEWNTEEIVMDGRRVKVTVNGTVIVDADLDEASKNGTMDKSKHPGLKRTMGYISFCGHGDKLWFRNVKVKPIVRADNTPPAGWSQVFNGKDLANWKGVTKTEGFDNPIKRAAATPEKRTEMQTLADVDSKLHWTVKNGVLCFDGKGFSLGTAKDYADFEMWCDWRLLTKKGDSGLYLRGSPQVQIWDAHNQWHIGSGGLYNNQKNPSKALLIADNQIGEWNTFYIRMIGEKVDVYLNGKRVVDNVTLENYWNRAIPIFPKEQIELQCHGDPIEFKNIFIREL
jgi:hypothetical protein